MQENCIEIDLGLPQLVILDHAETPASIIVSVEYRNAKRECPRCGQNSCKQHDWRWQWKQDRRVRDKPVWLKLRKRRFRCIWCQSVFTEPDVVCGLRRRCTQRLRAYLGQEALHQTVRRVARIENVGEGLVRRCVVEGFNRLLSNQPPDLTVPVILGVDEFAVKKRHVYNTTICDLGNRRIMGVVEGKGRKNLEDYLNGLGSPACIKAVAMDMHEPFRQAIQMCLPQAAIVVDKYHVIWHVNQALDKTRNRLQGGRWNAGQSRRLFDNRYTLLKSESKLTEVERAALTAVFQLYPDIKSAWELKEAFRSWYECRTRHQAEQCLQELEAQITGGAYPEFKKLLNTIFGWRQEILNYFDYRITNAFVEGKNNRIKTIKRMAYGYRNADTFRLRILAANHQSLEAFHTN